MHKWLKTLSIAFPLGIFALEPTVALNKYDAERIKRALEDVLNGVAAEHTNGKTVRGASGSLAAILRSADDVMCAGWQVHYMRVVEALERERAFADVTRQHEIDVAHQKLRVLENAIEKACDRVTNPDAYATVSEESVSLPTEPTTPTDNCDAECQRLRAAYFSALERLWNARTECRWLEASRFRIHGLRLAIEQTQRELAMSRRERDSAKRVYEKLRTRQNLRRWNNFREEVDQTEVRLSKFEQKLSDFDEERLSAEIETCKSRVREAERVKEAAYAEFVGRKPEDDNLTTTRGTILHVIYPRKVISDAPREDVVIVIRGNFNFPVTVVFRQNSCPEGVNCLSGEHSFTERPTDDRLVVNEFWGCWGGKTRPIDYHVMIRDSSGYESNSANLKSTCIGKQ